MQLLHMDPFDINAVIAHIEVREMEWKKALHVSYRQKTEALLVFVFFQAVAWPARRFSPGIVCKNFHIHWLWKNHWFLMIMKSIIIIIWNLYNSTKLLGWLRHWLFLRHYQRYQAYQRPGIKCCSTALSTGQLQLDNMTGYSLDQGPLLITRQVAIAFAD